MAWMSCLTSFDIYRRQSDKGLGQHEGDASLLLVKKLAIVCGAGAVMVPTNIYNRYFVMYNDAGLKQLNKEFIKNHY